MKAEIIAVGTELLLGQIANTNAQYISRKLAEEGIGVYHHVVVGDNPKRLSTVIKHAQDRSDLIIFTGGLGPTQDDLTKETIANVLNKKIIIDANTEEKIKLFFQNRNIPMSPNNIKQAMILEGSTLFPNKHGLAVGMGLTKENKIYILLPGPPSELNPMFDHYVIPFLHSFMDQKSMLYSRLLRFFGIGESTLVTELNDLIDQQTDPTIAPYAKEAEVTLRVTTRASSALEGEERLTPVLNEIRKRVGRFIYAEGEETSLEREVMQLLKQQGVTLSCAESCTGGLVSYMLTTITGASSSLKGSMVTYSNWSKEHLLQIDASLLNEKGAVSAEVAEQLAIQIRQRMETDWGISITGIAGPESVEDKPVGLVYIGIASKSEVKVKEFQFMGNRNMIQVRAAKTALFELWKSIKKGE